MCVILNIIDLPHCIPSNDYTFSKKRDILEDSLTSQSYADLALISSHCYAPADNRWPQRGQTNPRMGHAGAYVSALSLRMLCLQPCLPLSDDA